MRNLLEKLIKGEFRLLALMTRDRLHLTQREMSSRLYMAENSYSDIERGHTACGTLTMLLLLMMQEDPNEFLKQLLCKMKGVSPEEFQVV